MQLNSVVFSIIAYEDVDESAVVKKLFGTGFFINNSGHFLTASHVLRDAFAYIEKSNCRLVISPKQKETENPQNLFIPIIEYEYAPNPNDIAIGKTDYDSPTFFEMKDIIVGGWKDIAALGYPISSVHESSGEFRIQQSYLKGYVRREIPRGRHQNLSNPNLFEVSFPITRGLSGAPLFVHGSPNEKLIGVCRGSSQSSIVDYEFTEVHDGNKEYKEKNLRIEEYGLADDLRPLFSWKPSILNGKTLLEIT
ncbi:MAG: serine protease [Balneola sp.]|jgi:hypothetical protein